MKRIGLFSIILMVSVSLIGCSSNTTGQANPEIEKQQIAVAAPNPSDSDTGIASVSPTQQTLTEESTINVQGEKTAFSFHSIDFIDENTGWVVKGAFQSDQQGSQLLMTQDGGRHWKETKLDNMTLDQLLFIDKTTGWAIAHSESRTASGTQTYSMKILHTQDSGQNWDIQWENKAGSLSGCSLWFQDACGYALVGGTLLSTRDGGKQWFAVAFGVDHFTPQHMSFADADKGWIIGEIEQKSNSPSSDQNKETRLAVLRTTDGGKHWQKQFERTYAYGPVGSIDINFVNASTGWFLTSDSATWNGDLYYTANAGQDWKKISQIRCVRPAPTELEFITPDLGWIPLQVGAGGAAGGLMSTRDGGKSFEIIDSFSDMSSISEVDFISQKQGWAVGNALSCGDYIIHTTDGGKTWVQVYPQLKPTEDISFIDNRHGYGLGQLSDSRALLYTSDGGDTWENIHSFTEGCNPSMISFISRDTGWVLAGQKESARSLILKTSDGGKTWMTLDGDISQIEVYLITYMHFLNSDSGLLISSKADSTDIYRTQDGGRTWQVAEIKSEKGSIKQFAFVSERQGWEASVEDKAVRFNIMKGGSTWELLKQIGMDMYSYGIEFISEDKGWMLIEEPAYKSGSCKRLMFTADGGQTWSAHVFPDGFELDILASHPMQFTDDLHGWILTRYGLLKTSDGGRSWIWK